MSEFSQNNENITEEDFESGSTIFSAPVEKNDKTQKPKLLRKIIAVALVVLIIAGGTIVSAMLLPKLSDDDMVSSNIEEATIVDSDSKKYSSVSLKNEFGNLEFNVTEETTSSSASNSSQTANRVWLLKGFKPELISKYATSSLVDSLLGMKYAKVISDIIDSDTTYGFDKPKFEIIATNNSGSKTTITVGAKSPDESGYYVKTTEGTKVYLVKGTFVEPFNVKPLDLAEVPLVAGFKESEGSAEYYANGSLSKFDSLVLKTSKLDNAYTFSVTKEGEDATTLNTFKVVAPVKRAANDTKIGEILKLFSTGINGQGLYSFTDTDDEIKAYGLNNPDLEVSIIAGKQKCSIKAKLQSDGFYALISDSTNCIIKVSASDLTVASFGKTDIFSNFLFMQMLADVDKFSIESGTQKHTFEVITEKGEGDKDNIVGVKINGKDAIKSDNFQNYYIYLLGMVAVSYNQTDISSKTPDCTITMTQKDGTKTITVEYYLDSSGRYQVVVDGEQMGLISSTNYNTIFRYATNVANEKTYNS